MIKLIGASIVALSLAAVMAYNYLHQPVEYKQEAPKTIEVTKEVKVNEVDAKIEQREKELEQYYEGIKKLNAKLDVLKAERDALDAEITTTQKELADFTQGSASKN